MERKCELSPVYSKATENRCRYTISDNRLGIQFYSFDHRCFRATNRSRNGLLSLLVLLFPFIRLHALPERKRGRAPEIKLSRGLKEIMTSCLARFAKILKAVEASFLVGNMEVLWIQDSN